MNIVVSGAGVLDSLHARRLQESAEGASTLARLWVGLSTLAGVLGALVLVLRLTRFRQS